MKNLKIRTKMMLWYTLLTSILLMVFIPVLYKSIYNSLFSDAKSILRSTVSSVQAGIEYENNLVSWDENTVISDNMPTFVSNMTHQIIYSNSNKKSMMEVPFVINEIRTVSVGRDRWLVLDETVSKENSIIAEVRVFSPLNSIERTLNSIRIIILISIPAYFIITILGGLFIAKKALQPIYNIIQTAKVIGRGDLTKRIIEVESHDEVGELSETFNEMLEKLENSFNKEKRFVSDASHELRTPVAIIMSYAEDLLSESESFHNRDELMKSLNTIYNESKRMNAIISQLLALTRGDEGRYQINKEEFDILEVLNNVIEQLQEKADCADIKLSVATVEHIIVKADQSLITQMMLNLVENAIKYGKKSGNVWVGAEISDNELLITVKDDGIGITDEHLKHIFERFYRADQSRDRSGTGLGLSIVQWIINEHRGKIEVESQEDIGTTFKLHFKLK